MKLNSYKNIWDNNAKLDAMWAALTKPGGRGNWTAEDFFESGRKEIQTVMNELHNRGCKISGSEKTALDFGCGIGRLTQALCEYFDETLGIDISSEMIMQANEYNMHGDICKYIVNNSHDLNIISGNTIDFIYSRLVLQHIPISVIQNILHDFMRILKPGGIACFQLPSSFKKEITWLHKYRINYHIDYYLKSPLYYLKLIKQKPMKMHLNYLSFEAVLDIITDGKGQLLTVKKDSSLSAHESLVYFVEKKYEDLI